MSGQATQPRSDTGRRADPRPLYAGARGTAIKILSRVERTDAYLDKLLDSELRSTELNDPDKGLLTELVHGVLRWQNKLDWVLNGFSHGNFSKAEVNVKNAMRIALYQIMFLDRIPHAAAVNESVEFVKRIRGEKPAGLVNAVVRNIIRNLKGIRYPDKDEDPVQHLAVVYSHPFWIVKRWYQRFGFDETRRLLEANNERPSLSLRINRLKIEPGQFLSRLDEQEIRYSGSTHIDYFVKVPSLSRIAQMELFRNGCFTIQDESAALPCLLLGVQPGERIIDLCAAPGGKATHLAELMQNQGDVLAVDKYETKLNMMRGSCERLGVDIIRPLLFDAASLKHQEVDRVLLDAPCSGLGVLMKKPDIKWKRDITDLINLSKYQRELLSNASRLVRPGGILVYSTCTTEPEENQDVVRHFLGTHPEFSVDNAGGFVSSDLVTPEGYVETFPHRHGMDGSFAVRFKRAEKTPS
ncbi:MAG: 16S rRNA (cytosine(967)-C(5))-methyltransferase RsmB [Ignavibacteria bacterium]|nr:16S rRNA (cytosine(967)-C(5))-methyltransferase RsmB [Ignavibacteria bacterium]